MKKHNFGTDEPLIEKDGRQYREVVKKSALPIWAAAAVWIAAAIAAPMYSLTAILTVAALSAITGFAVSTLLPKETELVEVPFYTKNADLNATVREIQTTLSAIGDARTKLKAQGAPILPKIDNITEMVKKIRDAVIKQPSDLPRIRRFVNYYLPTTQKLIEKYAFLLEQQSDTANIEKTAASIDNALSQIDTACKHQLDALFEDDALDISTDIDVLDALLTRDNLK